MTLGWGFLLATVLVACVWADMTQDRSVAEMVARQAEASTTSAPPPSTTSVSRPVDCTDHLMRGEKTSGVYDIYPFTCTCEGRKLTVWCDMETDGGGWTFFLSRQKQTPQLEFNRTWNEYKEFFGNATGEYWMGLENLHAMTHARSYTMRLQMQLVTGGSTFTTWSSFKVADESNRYRLLLSGTRQGNSNYYYFRSQNNCYFSTIDRDNDARSGNSAITIGGGWWFYNGRYFYPTHNNFTDSLKLSHYSAVQRVTKLQLMIRPNICDASFKTIHLKDIPCVTCAK